MQLWIGATSSFNGPVMIVNVCRTSLSDCFQTTGIGASSPLPRLPATVTSLIPLRTLADGDSAAARAPFWTLLQSDGWGQHGL